jgi:acyl-CoA thioesterase-1
MSRIIIFSFFINFLFIGMACKDKQASQQDVVTDQMNKTETSTNPTKKLKKTILCFGNSLTAGFGLDESEAWPNLMQKRIDSLGLNYQVVNAGLSGETSSGGLSRIDWVLSQKVDLFFLELGANDMLRGIDVKSTEENLRNILQKVLEKYPNTPIVIAGMLSPPNMGKEYETAFNQIYNSLTKEYDASFIPFFLYNVIDKPELMLGDGKHPNADGQKLVLENIWEVMGEIL